MGRPLDSEVKLRVIENTSAPAVPDPLLTTQQVMQLLNCSESFIRKLRNSGELPAYRLSPRIIRYRASDIEDLIGSL